MKQVKSDLIYLEDICDAIGEIESFVSDGIRDLKTYRAVERNLEIIGEATAKISEDIKNKYPSVEWREIKAMRNIIAHEYSRVNFNMVWNIADNDLHILLENIQKIIKEL